MDASDRKKWIKFYRDELTDKEFYDRLSKRSEDAEFSAGLKRLSHIEGTHASFWKKYLERNGVKTDKLRPRRFKIKVLLFVSSILGQYLSVRLLEHGEIETCVEYSGYLKESKEDREFSEGLTSLLHDEVEHEEVFENRIKKTEEQITKNQDVIFGLSDGLVEVLAALAGLTAFIYDSTIIALGGLVVGVGGAISMALGAYLARFSESQYKISELKKKTLFDESGVDWSDLESLKASSRRSAVNVAFTYILGAIIPIAPFFFLDRFTALLMAIFMVAFSEALTNAIVALSMSTRMLTVAVRSALMSLGAAAATFGVGEIFHIVFHITLL